MPFLSVIFLPFWAHCYIWRGHFPGGVFHVFVLSLESTKDSSISCLFLRHAHKTSTSERLLAKVAQPGRGVNNSLRCGGSGNERVHNGDDSCAPVLFIIIIVIKG